MANANGLDDIRRGYNNVIRAAGDFDIVERRVADATSIYSKRISEQKVHLGEAIKKRGMFNKVVQEQLALQRAEAVAWRQMPDGRTVADLIMPKDAASRVMKTRMQISVFNELLRSSADNMVKWGKNTQWAGRQLTVGISVPMMIAAAATGKLAYEMDKSLTQITKVYGDANSEFQDTTESIRAASMDTAKNMASMYGQSAKDTLEITAQFAAAGKTGIELQNATAAATRARMLNEMDLQTSIEASIALQTVYGYSAEQLGEKWDYINAVANQTILGAEDFAVGIPKVAGVMKELGGTLEDVGTLLTAFKASGIDAAEGANALKTISFRAVSAYGKGLQTFTAMTGQNLQTIVKQTNGETIPTLLAMYKAMENLSAPQRIAVVKDVFGIYQGNKALMLMEQLAGASDQVAQAMAVGKNSVAENAKIANQELQRMNEQPFKRIQKAVESVKIAMQEIGKDVLPIVADGLETFAALLSGQIGVFDAIKQFFQGLKDSPAIVKAALVVGLAGPLTMLAGLMVNLVGNGLKLAGALGTIAARFKITNAEERTQVLLANQAANAWDGQTRAAASLALELRKLTMSYEQQNAELTKRIALGARLNSPNDAPIFSTVAAPDMSKYKTDKNGNLMRPNDNSRTGWSRMSGSELSTMAIAQRAADNEKAVKLSAQRAVSEMKSAEALRQQSVRYREVSQRAGAATAGAGMMVSLFGGEGWVSNLGTAAFAVGTISSLVPSLGANIAKYVVNGFRSVGVMAELAGGKVSKMRATIGAIGSGISGLARSLAGPFAIALAAGLAIWYKINDAEKKSAENMKEYLGTAQKLAELAGVNYTENISTRGLDKSTSSDDQGYITANEIAAKFLRESPAAAQQMRQAGDIWGEAIAKGVDIRLHGGTVTAAKEATRAALAVMGQRFTSDAEFEVEINAKVNFDDANQLLNQTMRDISRQMGTAVADDGKGFWQGVGRALWGSDDLTKAGAEIAKVQGKKMSEVFLNASEEQRPDVIKRLAAVGTTAMEPMYKELAEKNKRYFKQLGINNIDEFQNAMEDKKIDWSKLDVLQLDANGVSNYNFDFATLDRSVDSSKQVLRSLALELGVFNESNIETLDSWDQLIAALNLPQKTNAKGLMEGQIKTQAEAKAMADEYNAVLKKRRDAGMEVNRSDEVTLANQIRLAHGYDYVIDPTLAFVSAQKEAVAATYNLATAMDQLDFNPAISQEQVVDSYKAAITGTLDDLYSTAADQASAYDDAVLDAIDKEMDNALKGYEDKSDQLQDKFDKQKDAFDKKWDDRKERENDYYDNRIKKIDEAIQAEQKADDTRQRIYEAEKARIERLANMFNKNIDFNAALNTGNLDEAAKIGNDMRAQTEQWLLDDAMAGEGDKSQAKVDALGAQKDKIQEAKQERMKALDDIKKSEEDALKHSQDMAKKRLDADKDATRQSYEDKKKNVQAETEARRRALEVELATIRAFIPRNEAELKAQASRIDAAYKAYGVKLTGYGRSWSEYVGIKMNENIKKSGEALRSDIAWTSIGSDIAKGLLNGGFGMSPKQFAAWLNGGEAPPGSVFAPTKAAKMNRKQQEQFDLRHFAKHSGGIVGKVSGSRTGHSGSQSPSEVWVNALKGEGILNRKATDALGEENIMALNKGKMPAKTGPWGMGGMSLPGMGAAMAAAAGKGVMNQVLMGLAVRRMQQQAGVGEFAAKAGSAGAYGKVSLSQEQLNNAATIMGVGRSMGASQRDLVIAIMTAMQESTLRNLKYGDRDSLGLFQQRPSQGWGTPEQINNPSYAARKFFQSLLAVKDRGAMSLSAAAQAVQRSAYPEAYAKWEAMARSVVGGTQIVGSDQLYTGLGSGINLGQYGTGGAGGAWVMPASGPVTSRYGMRVNPVTGQYRLHAGSDIGAANGAAIQAAKAGRVVSAGMTQGYGNYTIIDHGNGVRTAYAHQSKMLVTPGQIVSAGQLIGKVGNTGNSTGPHLHFEYMKDGVRMNPNQIIPQLWKGGHTLNTGLANLHPKETVLTEPLSEKFKSGVDRFANGGNDGYNITVDFRGAVVQSDVDIERAVTKAIEKHESKLGRSRTVGNKK